jgi:hypothetical protein
MSIETLQADFQRLEQAVEKPDNPSAEGAWAFLRDNLVPWMGTLATEIAEMDEAIEEAYHGMPDVLHEEVAEVFAGIIASGAILVTELRKRVGNDQRLLAMIKEWNKLAEQGKEILEEITIADPDPDADQDADAPAGATADATATASEGGQP